MAVCRSFGNRSTTDSTFPTEDCTSESVVIILDFSFPRVMLTYRSARESYTVSITVADTFTPRAVCRIVTESQRRTRSRSAEYSGCFHRGSNATLTVGTVVPSGFSLM